VTRRGLSGAVAILATAACSKPYSGTVSVTPSGTVTAPVTAYVPVYAKVYSGGSPAPMILTDFVVRCLDPAVCATVIVPGGRGSEGRVAGLQIGETDVVVSYEHPVNKTRGEGSFHVKFVAASQESLAVGKPLPPDTREDRMLLASDVPGMPVGGNVFSCRHDTAMPLRDLGPAYQRAVSQQAFFACEPPAEVVPGKKHLCLSSFLQNRWNWGDHAKETVQVCTSLRDGRIEGLRFYGTRSDYRSVELGDVGTLDPAQCPHVTGS
jgi:hypothetical protein